MYRYLLFHYYNYYPCGGMGDCDFKTNNFDELVPFINKHYAEDMLDRIHYYDVVEDKIYDAVMESYETEEFLMLQRFVEWKEH